MSTELDIAKKLLLNHATAATATAGDYALVSIAESLETITRLLQQDFDEFHEEITETGPVPDEPVLKKEGLA